MGNDFILLCKFQCYVWILYNINKYKILYLIIYEDA